MSWRPNHWTLRSWGFFAMSVRRPAAGDVEHRAGRERAVLRPQPAHQRGDLVDRDEAAHRDLREHVVDVLLRHLVEYRGLRGGGRHAIDENTCLSQFLPQRLR